MMAPLYGQLTGGPFCRDEKKQNEREGEGLMTRESLLCWFIVSDLSGKATLGFCPIIPVGEGQDS